MFSTSQRCDEQLEPAVPASKRAGYVVSIGVNAGLLYVAHHLLEWGWPSFLTGEFEQLLPIITLSFLVSIAVNVVFFVTDDGLIRAVSDLATSSVAFAVGVRTLRVFPFDFAEYAVDWSPLVGVVIVVGLIGTAAAFAVSFIRLATGLLLR